MYNKPPSLRALKTNICKEIRKIPIEMLQKVMENAEKRANACITAKGRRLRDIIFHNLLVAISMNCIKYTLKKEVRKFEHFNFI